MSESLKERLAEAYAIYRAGDFNQAEQCYLELQQIAPTHIAILTRLGEIALWKNRTDEAEQYFNQASCHASWLAQRWPFNAQLQSSLAMTYYRQDQFAQAAQCFREAAGPLPLVSFRDLKALATQLALFKDQIPYQIEGSESARIPFVVTDPLPVIQVSINGGNPVPFFIDTGGAEVILDTQMAETVGAVRAGRLSGEGGGTKGHVGLGKVDRLSFANLHIHNVPVHIMDMQPFSAVFRGLPVKGIIGTRLLMHFLSTIDYVHACLILQPKMTPTPFEREKARVTPFWLIQTHYIVAHGTFNGRAPMLFFVDTGVADKGFSASESVLQEAGVRVDWSKAEKGIAGFGESESIEVTADRLSLGSDDNEVVAFSVPGIMTRPSIPVLGYKLGFFIGGVVSHQFFRSYALTLDFVGMRLILLNPAS